MFIGREMELDKLRGELHRPTAGLIVCRGRRRIGKSTLLEKFGKSAQKFYEFQGLSPHEGMTVDDQLRNFSSQFSRQFNLPALATPSDWSAAFDLLARYTGKGQVVILLDEISWMASGDKGFAGKLKFAWDTGFKKNPRLLLVLCGSVTSWIDDNILNSAAFVGRVSLKLTLEELPLHHCREFWGERQDRISGFEKLQLLCVTGGVPRYLEEIRPDLSAEENIKRLCFSPTGILFSEFDDIFNDVFSKRHALYQQIVRTLVPGKKSFGEICRELDRDDNGVMSRYLHHLMESGFIAHDPIFSLSSRRSKLGKYRLKDNYLRFYLKYLEPVKDQIGKGLYQHQALARLPEWDTIMGYSFENLVLNNLATVCRLLSIPLPAVKNASPYFQRRTRRTRACQIDLLIHTKNALYPCEVKFRMNITREVIAEVQEKVARLKPPRTLSIRPVLIGAGEISPEIEEEGYFNNILRLEDLFQAG